MKPKGETITAFMRRHGISRIADLSPGFTVAMRGNILGTGETVEEAFQSAMADKVAREAMQVAA